MRGCGGVSYSFVCLRCLHTSGSSADVHAILMTSSFLKMMRNCFKHIAVGFVQQLLAPKKYNCRNDNDTSDLIDKFEREITEIEASGTGSPFGTA